MPMLMLLQGALKRKKTDGGGPNLGLATREKDKVETIYILERHELPNQKLKLVSDRTIAQSQFRWESYDMIWFSFQFQMISYTG